MAIWEESDLKSALAIPTFLLPDMAKFNLSSSSLVAHECKQAV
jgi:hypothetical protein